MIKPEVELELERKHELLRLANDHVEECKRLERRGKGLTHNEKKNNNPTVTELPALDDEAFNDLRAGDAQIVSFSLESHYCSVFILRQAQKTYLNTHQFI